ncbi:MAG: sigma 54-interacting transcriptional regulator [Planctomycetota bacterium]
MGPGSSEVSPQTPHLALKPVKLIVQEGSAKRPLVFRSERVTIGRALSCDVRIDNGRVSRLHASIHREGGQYLLVDEGSQNGTYVNGVQVLEAALQPGDHIEIGEAHLWFDEPDPTRTTVARRANPSELIRTLTRERSNLLRLQRINRAISLERDLDKLLGLIIDAAIELTGAERGFLIHYRQGEPVLEVARNFEGDEVDQPELAISRSITDKVRQTGEPLMAVNARDDDRFREIASISNLGLRSVLAVPFRFQGEVVGVVYVDNRLAKEVFGQDDLRLVEALADQAAIALQQATLVEELRRTNAQVKESAERVQTLAEELKRRVAVQEVELAEARARLKERSADGARFDYSRIIGRSKPMQDLFRLLDRIVESDFPVLIQGESGTGKELIARAIHENSPRKERRYVSENCAALPDTLLESELFGYEKGAFTGANTTKKGLLEIAHEGTLFLDEVGEMSPQMQKKLLRVLQDGEFRRLGGREPIHVDVRLLSASNRDLQSLVEAREFREDLYFRINVLPVMVPPLRQRLDDIPLLVDYFMKHFAAESNRPAKTLRPEVLDMFQRHRWPGNVRELENEVRKLLTLGDDLIGVECVSERIRLGAGGETEVPAGSDLISKVESMERNEIRRALREAGRNKSRAAALLGISRFTLQRKLEKYGIDLGEG